MMERTKLLLQLMIGIISGIAGAAIGIMIYFSFIAQP